MIGFSNWTLVSAWQCFEAVRKGKAPEVCFWSVRGRPQMGVVKGDIGKEIMSSSHGLEYVHSERSKFHASKKICQSTVQPKKHSKFPRGHRINWEKKVRNGKTRYLPVKEALASIKKYGSPLINIVSSRVVSTKSMANVTRGIFSKPRAQI